MTNKIAFINAKGGVGKTTSIYHVAGVLARRGEKTLVIDFDKQRNLSDTMFMHSGGLLHRPKYTVYDCLLHKTAETAAATGKALFKKRGNANPSYYKVDCMPGDIRLEDEKKLRRVDAGNFGEKLTRFIDEQGYKWLLVDMPPSSKAINDICLSSIVDFIIAPFSSDIFSVSGFDDLMDTVSRAREHNPVLSILGIYLSRFVRNCAVDKYIKEQFEAFGNIFIDVQIPFAADIRESVMFGRPISFYRNKSASSVIAYERLVGEIENRINSAR